MTAERLSSRVDFSLLAQVVKCTGDVWLCAGSCAIFLGMFTPSGQPNRRGFQETISV